MLVANSHRMLHLVEVEVVVVSLLPMRESEKLCSSDQIRFSLEESSLQPN
jgi:hypothetical protein